MTFPAVLSRLLLSWIGAERLHRHFKLLLNIAQWAPLWTSVVQPRVGSAEGSVHGGA